MNPGQITINLLPRETQSWVNKENQLQKIKTVIAYSLVFWIILEAVLGGYLLWFRRKTKVNYRTLKKLEMELKQYYPLALQLQELRYRLQQITSLTQEHAKVEQLTTQFINILPPGTKITNLETKKTTLDARLQFNQLTDFYHFEQKIKELPGKTIISPVIWQNPGWEVSCRWQNENSANN